MTTCIVKFIQHNQVKKVVACKRALSLKVKVKTDCFRHLH